MLKFGEYHNSLDSLFNNLNSLQDKLGSYEDYPSDITEWLGKLKLLYNVPLNYLVPDERMLPPESIRFFYLDPNWVDALVDGAFSIGRDPAVNVATHSLMMDMASLPLMSAHSATKSLSFRSAYLGLDTPQAFQSSNDRPVISGFLLRSRLVKDCPGLGVDAYPENGVPAAGNPGNLLNILRMEVLGPQSDVMICMFDGEVYRADIHSAPEALHYGIEIDADRSRHKTFYYFTKNGNEITINTNESYKISFEKDDLIRNQGNSRTIEMSKLAGEIGHRIGEINSAEMGFEMTEGVDKVSFIKR